MNAFVVAAVLSATMFVDMVVEVSAEITTDIFLDDHAGAIAETIPEPQSPIVDMTPQAAVLHWRRPGS